MKRLKQSRLQFVLRTLQILMLLQASYLLVLKKAYCRGSFLLLILEDQHGLDYFEKHFNSSQDMLLAFKAARYFSPQKINDIQPNVEAINALKSFPFLNSKTILDGLKGELPSYLAKVTDIDSSIDILQWWNQNESALPCWATAARKVLLVQPSSAASERVFSLLKASFNPQQQSLLQDYIETSLILQYNVR